MENFIVSARKYRPQTFDTVVGQKSITVTLKNAIKNNHLAQAFLFCGPRGVGKTTCARILAKTINCENISENLEACNQCESCVSFNQSASFNIHELDAASNNSVDDIRNLVDRVRIPPQVGKYKVYIIDEVHMLSQAAFNAFLKTLEEPPDYAKFILATTEKHKIIPTILSRCQIYDFKRITVEDIAGYLAYVAEQEGVTAEPDALHIIAQKSDGALRDALSIFDQIVSFGGKNITYKNVIENLNVLDYDYYFKITESIVNGDIRSALLIINEIIDNGFDGQHFIIGFGDHLRDLLVCKDIETIKLLEVGGSIKSKYQEQSALCSLVLLLKMLDINNKCDIYYKTSNNKKLHLELALMQMCSVSASDDPQNNKMSLHIPEKPKEPYKTGYTQKKSVINEPSKVPYEKKLSDKSASATRTISIKNHVKERSNKKEIAEEDLNNKPAEKFSSEQLEILWNNYAETKKTDKNYYITLTRRKPELKNDNIVELTVDNKVQENELKDKKSEILGFLRKELNNYQVQLNVKVVEHAPNDKPYTPQEKFNRMAEKNPALKKLKEQLNLEIDF
ncbi:MAG: DNA polymerase III subunit gamma/tau [Bacteroidetes bacterium]|nr:DNA polymerase III subunit gamma/tau [Bacteroidota bacterium]MBL7105695.1 DNA polymerase III subunit gamma/tau [Bacteroidales bacterium]